MRGELTLALEGVEFELEKLVTLGAGVVYEGSACVSAGCSDLRQRRVDEV
jgi:hypothetical protein